MTRQHQEIEAKFLLWEEGGDHSTSALRALWPSVARLRNEVLRQGEKISQGYLPQRRALRLASRLDEEILPGFREARLRRKGDQHFLTFKWAGTAERPEQEFAIGEGLFKEFWPHTEGKRIAKVRLRRELAGILFEFDVYTDRDLVVAEAEVKSVSELSGVPRLGRDVTEDPSYKNHSLAR